MGVPMIISGNGPYLSKTNGEAADRPLPRSLFKPEGLLGALSAASASALALAKLKARGDVETHWGEVDLQGLGLLHELLVHEVGEAVDVQHVVVRLRLVQSQRQ